MTSTKKTQQISGYGGRYMYWRPRNIVVFLSILAASISLAGNDEEDIDYWCNTAISEIVEGLTDEGRSKLQNISNSEGLIQFHLGWGTGIRNELLLWDPESKYYQSCSFKFGFIEVSDTETDEYGIPKLIANGHPEGISGLIIKAVWERVSLVPEKDI